MMEYTIHKISKEEKLLEIALKHGVSAKSIKENNPNAMFFKTITGTEYAAAMQDLSIPKKIKKQAIDSSEKTLHFVPKARYRCKQNNITKALEEVTFSSVIETQYLFSSAGNSSNYYQNELEEYHYSVEPDGLGRAFELFKSMEFIKGKVTFEQESSAFKHILNLSETQEKWNQFVKKDLDSISFFKDLKQQNPDTARDLIQKGNEEFQSPIAFTENLNKNLFYHLLLRVNENNKWSEFEVEQPSQIFPNQLLRLHVRKDQVAQDAHSTTYRLVGTLDPNSFANETLEKQYNEIYRSLLRFSYSEFNFIYRITYVLSNKDNTLLDAQITISERVKNNFECITQFQITRIEL